MKDLKRSATHGYTFVDGEAVEIPISYLGRIGPRVYIPDNMMDKIPDEYIGIKFTAFSENGIQQKQEELPVEEEPIVEEEEPIVEEEKPVEEEPVEEEPVEEPKLKYKKRIKTMSAIDLFKDHQKYSKRISKIQKQLKKL